MLVVEITSMDLGIGPDPRVLAVSDFVESPGPGVVLVDLNGQGMLITMTVGMDDSGAVYGGGCHHSGMGVDLWDGCATVTGRTDQPQALVRVTVTSEADDESFSFDVHPGAEGWYAGCRPLPPEWEGIPSVSVSMSERA
jgi:hypothetical protein